MKYRKTFYLWPWVPIFAGGILIGLGQPSTTIWWIGWCAESFAMGMCLAAGWGIKT